MVAVVGGRRRYSAFSGDESGGSQNIARREVFGGQPKASLVGLCLAMPPKFGLMCVCGYARRR